MTISLESKITFDSKLICFLTANHFVVFSNNYIHSQSRFAISMNDNQPRGVVLRYVSDANEAN